jgi:hypothetical protein
MTDEMLALAQRNAREAEITNVHFLKGVIEQIPLPAESVDVVISNCVINLSTDKPAVLTEIARVLRPGGTIGISDVVAEDRLASDERAERGSYVGCIAGALSKGEYIAGLEAVGFEEISVAFTHQVADGMHGAIVKGTKAQRRAESRRRYRSPRRKPQQAAAEAPLAVPLSGRAGLSAGPSEMTGRSKPSYYETASTLSRGMGGDSPMTIVDVHAASRPCSRPHRRLPRLLPERLGLSPADHSARTGERRHPRLPGLRQRDHKLQLACQLGHARGDDGDVPARHQPGLRRRHVHPGEFRLPGDRSQLHVELRAAA